jgi:hypothetical protein
MSNVDEPPGDIPGERGFQGSDVICTVPWGGRGFHAIEVYADPALLDRADELCGTVGDWAESNEDADSMVSTVLAYSGDEDITAAILEDPEDPSTGVMTIAFTA